MSHIKTAAQTELQHIELNSRGIAHFLILANRQVSPKTRDSGKVQNKAGRNLDVPLPNQTFLAE
jgi:hypothetical protein